MSHAEDSKSSSVSHLELVTELFGHKDRVWCAQWNPSGTVLATCGGDSSIRLWGKRDEKWACLNVLEGVHSRTVRSIAWSPNSRLLASCGFDGIAAIWKNEDGDLSSERTIVTEFQCIAQLEGHENEVKSLSWSKSGHLLATCSRDKSVWIWEEGEDNDFECLSVLHGHAQDVKHVKWHPFDDILASASYDDTIKLWHEDESDWYCLQTLEGHSSTVWSLCFNRTGNRLASCSDDKSVRVWERQSDPSNKLIPHKWVPICTHANHHERTIFSVDWSSLGLIATGAADDAIRIFFEPAAVVSGAPSTQQLSLSVEHRQAHGSDVNCVAWNPSLEESQARMLASAGDDGVVKLWHYSGPLPSGSN